MTQKNWLVPVILLLCVASQASGQACNYDISGYIKDHQQKPVIHAAVRISNGPATYTDTAGYYHLGGLCAGNYTINCSVDSFMIAQKTFVLNSNITLNFTPFEPSTDLKEVVVSGTRVHELSTLHAVELDNKQLFQTTGRSLGESLKNIPGINTIQTGPGISKPVIHGLHSNRVLILNNGIRQEGQQWGSEHAPEIDPFIAGSMTIIEGAASLRYGSDAIAGVILLNPPALIDERLKGEVNLVGASNGRMGAVSGLLNGAGDKKWEGFQWRVQGTLKRAGNFKTANYYLNNSGIDERDFSGTMGYHREHFGLYGYYSSYHTKMGIFDGSHVGNLNDLYAAFARTKPITPSYFSYKINRSYQEVTHDLLKLNSYYNFNNNGRAEIVFARQSDLRNEYDVDLPYSSDPAVLNAPQVSFKIKTHTLDLTYHTPERNHFSGTYGVSGITQGNVFRGIRYLVPNFRNYGSGVFAIEKYTRNKWTLEGGLRYDYRWLKVYRRNDNSLTVYTQTHTYNNLTAAVGATWQATPELSISGNSGTAWRAPSVSELYIRGIHLSAASYEIGDSTLQAERSINNSISFKYNGQKLFVQLNFYDNEINNYIYAKPSLTGITLVSGTYPVFQYTQANVRLRGLDAEVNYHVLPALAIISKAAIVRGYNKSIHDYLVFMPADKFDNSVKFGLPDHGHFKQSYVSLQYVYTAKQTRVPPNSDYVAPPPGYGLLNYSMGTDLHLHNNPLNISLSIENLTNVAYRDYLNRFRYYADDLGINFILRTKLTF
ncbi:TonB-dependent receptor [Chitinophaga sp.]|uniref:TonB-dependent receptor n=1 Tax=Chitinophaga sp. TaxID=1869181 RepID=UPI0031CEDEE9